MDTMDDAKGRRRRAPLSVTSPCMLVFYTSGPVIIRPEGGCGFSPEASHNLVWTPPPPGSLCIYIFSHGMRSAHAQQRAVAIPPASYSVQHGRKAACFFVFNNSITAHQSLRFCVDAVVRLKRRTTLCFSPRIHMDINNTRSLAPPRADMFPFLALLK